MKVINLIAGAVLTALAMNTAVAAPGKGSGDQGGTPYQASQSATFDSSSPSRARITFDYYNAVPAGQRLIIENVTYKTKLPEGQVAECIFVEAHKLGPGFAFLPPAQPTLPWGGHIESHGNLQTRIFVEEGDFVFQCSRTKNLFTGQLWVTVTGTLVDAY